jgi:hypothetical protein
LKSPHDVHGRAPWDEGIAGGRHPPFPKKRGLTMKRIVMIGAGLLVLVLIGSPFVLCG